MRFDERAMTFRDADRYYLRLKELRDGGVLNGAEFENLLKRLMVRDEAGRWWAKSRNTGDWHYYDGAAWVREALPNDEVERKQETEPRETFAEKLIKTCAKYTGSGYFVGQTIPETKLAAARKAFPILTNEQVFALIDNSGFLAKGMGLAVCQEGIRWRSDASKGYFIGWQEFSAVPIVGDQLGMTEYTIDMGWTRIYVGKTSTMPKDEAVRLLIEIQALAKDSFPREET
jgi:hypothetical protein